MVSGASSSVRGTSEDDKAAGNQSNGWSKASAETPGSAALPDAICARRALSLLMRSIGGARTVRTPALDNGRIAVELEGGQVGRRLFDEN